MAKTKLTRELEECIIADIRQLHSGKRLTEALEKRIVDYVEKSVAGIVFDSPRRDSRLFGIFKQDGECCKGKCK